MTFTITGIIGLLIGIGIGVVCGTIAGLAISDSWWRKSFLRKDAKKK